MKNLDALKAKKTEIAQKLKAAMDSGDEGAFTQAFTEFMDNIEEAVTAEAKGMMESVDTNVLAGRGVRQLTSNEKDFYQKVIAAMQSPNPKQSLSSLDDVMPKTVIDAIFEDLVAEHPLLEAINFVNTSGLTEYLVNTNAKELATWAGLTSEITKELASGFKKISLSMYKLSAFLPVAKAMLDLGPAWLDRYARAILGEALAFGLEEGGINGTGKSMPIGMNRQVGDGVTVTDGVYPLKTPVAITNLDPVTYGSLVASLSVSPSGKTRVIKEVLLIVSPADYLTKIMPATTIRAVDGTYVNNVFPFPTKVIQSVQVPAGKAIIGIGNRYFMGIGTAKSGKIEYSDEYKFLEDERVYLVKLYGNGEPLDNNAFIYLDISGLLPAVHQVYVTNSELGVNLDDDEILQTMSINDARLASLSIGSLTLSPTFNKSVFVYTAATTNATNTITAVAKDGEGTIAILNGATPVANGAAATWAEGANIVTISVTSGTETETYTITVTKSA